MNGFRVHFHAAKQAFLSIDGCFHGIAEGLVLRLEEGVHCLRLEREDAPPMVKVLTVDEAGVSLSGAEVYCWPDSVAEVFLPLPVGCLPTPRERVRLGDGIRAAVYEQTVTAQADSGIGWAHAIPFLEEKELYLSGESLILKGSAGGRGYVLILHVPSGECLREEWAEEVLLSRSGERIALIQKMGDLPLIRQRLVDVSGEELSMEWAEQECEDTVKRFLSALVMGREGEVMSLLSHSLRRECDFTELKGFFGEIHTVREPVFCSYPPVTMMLGRRQEKRVFLTPYHFTLTGEGKIDNFCEL